MKIQLSDRFTYGKLLRFTLPSVVMLIFTSVYGVVDGFFVSNFVGKTAFSAVNFIMPFLMILGAVGFMFGTGGGALIAKTLGEGKAEQANRLFSLIVYVSLGSGFLLTALGFICIRPLAAALGVAGRLWEDSVLYGRVSLLAVPAYILQYEFQCLFAVAGKPALGLSVTVAAGIANMALDALFVGVFGWGIAGAAAATEFSQCVGGFLPLAYFARPNDSLLRLGRTAYDGRSLGKACLNGASELMSNISMSVVNMLYNVQLLRYAGEDGIAAYGVLMYVSLVFQAMFIGYSVGAAPIISFHYGAQNREELQGLRKKSFLLIAVFSGLMFAASCGLSKPLSFVFTGYDRVLYEMTAHAFYLFAVSFLFSGYAIFGSAFFTALNDGPVSAAISFLRTFVFQAAAVLALPMIWELNGIWLATAAAEALAAAVTAGFLCGKQKKYRY